MEFEFYLDAYHYCIKNGIPITLIKKKSFKVWKVDHGIMGTV